VGGDCFILKQSLRLQLEINIAKLSKRMLRGDLKGDQGGSTQDFIEVCEVNNPNRDCFLLQYSGYLGC
jgi:hypothetical protein